MGTSATQAHRTPCRPVLRRRPPAGAILAAAVWASCKMPRGPIHLRLALQHVEQGASTYSHRQAHKQRTTRQPWRRLGRGWPTPPSYAAPTKARRRRSPAPTSCPKTCFHKSSRCSHRSRGKPAQRLEVPNSTSMGPRPGVAAAAAAASPHPSPMCLPPLQGTGGPCVPALGRGQPVCGLAVGVCAAEPDAARPSGAGTH